MQSRPLPVATPSYDPSNEQSTRRTIEQSFQDLDSKVEANTSKTSKPSSLALRRFQFLLMGASGG